MIRPCRFVMLGLAAGAAASTLALLTPFAAVGQTCGDWTEVDPPVGARLAFTDVEVRSRAGLAVKVGT